MYIGNLPYKTTENDLRRLFKKYEPIHSIILIADKATDHPRGYGFIELDERKAAMALSDLRNITYNGRLLRFCKATGTDPRQKTLKKHAERKIMAAYMRKKAKRFKTATEYMVLDANNYG
jgi:RNA recognition motif-containing protein